MKDEEIKMTNPRPTAISADREAAKLTIKWNTGEVAEIPFDLLRNSCPCASCRGGHENMKKEPDASMFVIPLMDANKLKLSDIQMMGDYAISILWADGHKDGIYNWDYLYSLYKQLEVREIENQNGDQNA
jgi:DUF971 family protein